MSANMTTRDYHFFNNLNTEILATYAGALAVVLPLVALLIKLVLRPRVVVNCWFCNTNSKVTSSDANSWYCPNCEQYNGFLPNGDYNKDIPEQREGSSRSTFSVVSKTNVSSESNGLCEKCNSNQEMKVRHLAAFQPADDSYYVEELNTYSHQLENAYRLCQKCEGVVSETLERKKGLVLGIQLQQSEKRILGRSKLFIWSQVGLYRGILTAVAATICMMTATATPLLKNMDLPLLRRVGEQVEANYWAVLGVNFLVQLVLTLCTARKLPLALCGAHLCLYLWEDQWRSVEDYSYALSLVSGLTLVVTLCSNRTRKSAFVKIKKIEKSSSKLAESQNPLVVPETKPSVTRSWVTKPSVKVEERSQPVRMEQDCEQEMFKSSVVQDDTSSVDSAFSNHDSVTQDSDPVRGDVNSLIQSLSEWNSGVEERPRTPSSRHEFQSRQYKAVLKPLLNPPRLVSPKSTSPRSVNESSWVAGGFWHNHQNEAETSSSSRPGSPNSSFYSTASSWRSSTPPPPSVFEPLRPATPTHYPMYVPYSPPNGFQQAFGYQPGFQPFGYPVSPVVNPMWNPGLFQPIPSSATTPSSASCSSASTCGSVRRRPFSDEGKTISALDLPEKQSGFFRALWHNSSVIFYTSVFYVTVTTVAIILYHKS